MRAEYTPVFELLSSRRRDFEAFHSAGATNSNDEVKSTLQRQISPQHGFITRTFLL